MEFLIICPCVIVERLVFSRSLQDNHVSFLWASELFSYVVLMMGTCPLFFYFLYASGFRLFYRQFLLRQFVAIYMPIEPVK